MMAYDTKLDVFGWLQALGRGSHFNDHMAGYRQGRTPWIDSSIYPVQSRLVDGAGTSVDAPFLVDIGGNRGHDLQEFQRYHPDTPGRLYLQDVEAVISSIESLSSSITPICYDFHTEQPIKGKGLHTDLVVTRKIADHLKPRCPCILHTFLPA